MCSDRESTLTSGGDTTTDETASHSPYQYKELIEHGDQDKQKTKADSLRWG